MGMAEMQYSVSLPRRRQSTGPKPMEKRSTPTPDRRAIAKWPSSWTRMRMPRTTTNETMEVTPLPSGPQIAGGPGHRHLRSQRAGHLAAGGRVGVQACLEVAEAPGGHALEGLCDQGGDAGESDAPAEEGRHRHLVGGVENGGGA